MKKKKKQRHHREDSPMSQMTAPLRESAKAFNWKLALIVVVNTIIIFGFYRLMLHFYYFEIVMGLYLALTAVFTFAYVIYNRGFSGKGVTPEMLPDTMSLAEKEKFIEDAKLRLHKSNWMLTLIFPAIFTVGCDMFYLFVIEGLFAA
jgi:Ca2+/Na+ antiporter